MKSIWYCHVTLEQIRSNLILTWYHMISDGIQTLSLSRSVEQRWAARACLPKSSVHVAANPCDIDIRSNPIRSDIHLISYLFDITWCQIGSNSIWYHGISDRIGSDLMSCRSDAISCDIRSNPIRSDVISCDIKSELEPIWCHNIRLKDLILW